MLLCFFSPNLHYEIYINKIFTFEEPCLMFLNFLFSQQHVLRNIWILPIPQHILSFFISNLILWMLSFDFEHQNFVATNELFSTGSGLCFRFTSFWDIKFYFYFGRLSLSLVNRWPLICVSFNWMFRFSKHITLLRLPRYFMRIHNTKCYSLFLSRSFWYKCYFFLFLFFLELIFLCDYSSGNAKH